MDPRVSVDVKRLPSLLSAALPIRTMEVIPTPETHRQYVDEKNGKLRTAATSHDGADAKFRRAVFDLFAGTRALLTRVTVGDLIGQFRKRGKVETLSVDATCGEALDLLANPEPGILSAPVIDQDRLLVRPDAPTPFPNTSTTTDHRGVAHLLTPYRSSWASWTSPTSSPGSCSTSRRSSRHPSRPPWAPIRPEARRRRPKEERHHFRGRRSSPSSWNAYSKTRVEERGSTP